MNFDWVREALRGPSFHSEELFDSRRLNFSFVLHEPSTSETIAAMARTSLASSAGDRDANALNRVINLEAIDRIAPDVILTAHLGSPAILSKLTANLPAPPSLVTIDGEGQPYAEARLFRATAQLVLPEQAGKRAIVAAAVNRPGGREIEIVASGPFRWPESSMEALEALEGLILAHVDQWRPPRALWCGPTETQLPEVLDKLDSGPLDTR